MSHLAQLFGTWAAPGCPYSVEYSLDAMERVREHILERFYSIPRGGAEAGGVLFGRFVDGQLRILAAQPAACEYSKGPTFTLSARDEAAFKGLLFPGEKDGLAGMRPVGWYRSRTRGEPYLTAEDVDLWGRHFPHPWQLVLVLRPASVGVMRGAVFFREEDGSVRTESVFPELQLFPRETRGGGEKIQVEELALEPLPAVPEPLPMPIPRPPNLPKHRSRSRRHLWVAALLLVALSPAVYFAGGRLGPIARLWQGPPVGLHMERIRDGIMVRWDPRSGAVQRATGATLHVEDELSSSAVPLDAARLRNGFAHFRTQSATPRPRLILRQPDGQTVVAVLEPGPPAAH